MKSAIKKFLSIILATITLLSTCSATMWAFAASEDKSVVDSGFCGLYGDNLKWTLYSYGELVISGTGEMDWYNKGEKKNTTKLAPWTEYYDDIEVITIEEGVTSIGNYAFISENIQYHKVTIPKSLQYFEGDIFECTKRYQIPGKHIAFCYAGSQNEWKNIERKNVIISYNSQSKELVKEYFNSRYDNSINYIEGPVYMDLCFNGKKPADFCDIIKPTTPSFMHITMLTIAMIVNLSGQLTVIQNSLRVMKIKQLREMK